MRLRIKDTSTIRQRFTDTQLINIINEGHRDIINNKRLLYAGSSFFLVPGQQCYNMLGNFLDFYRVVYTSGTNILDPIRVFDQGYVLSETSQYALDSLNSGINWNSISGSPQYYFQDISQPDYICIYPVPNAVSSGTILFTYYLKANVLSNLSDTPFNNYERFQDYSDLLVYYTAEVIYTIEGENNKAKNYMDIYSSRSDAMAKEVSNHPNFTPGMAGPAQSR